jgi:Sulfatase
MTSPFRRVLADDSASPGWCLLELVALSGLAVAQPVLDVIGQSPDIFVVRRAGWADVLLLVVIVVLGPPLVGWAIELIAGLAGRRARHLAHLTLLTVLAVLFAIQLVKEVTDLGGKRLLAAGLASGIVLVALVTGVRGGRSALRLVAAFPLVLAVLFLSGSPAREVVLGRDAASVADVVATEPAPVVMVVLDELPLGSLLDAEGRVDEVLFPNFAALAGGSTWYRNHTTVAPTTVEAVPAILTGRWPLLGRPSPTAATYPENLFTLLGGQYALHVSEIGTRLCPASLCPVPAYGALPELLRDAREVWTSQASPEPSTNELDLDVGGDHRADVVRAGDVEDFTEELGRSGATPRLDFLHAFLPHGGWTFLPSGARYVGPHPPAGNVFFSWVDEFAADAARARHLLQLQYTDALLGGILDRLRELGTYDESLVVVTADHGVSFRAGETMRAPTSATYPDVMWTPLFIKAPGQSEGEVVDEPARSIDVVPTIADHLGLELPWSVDGGSLLDRPGRGDEVRILASSAGTDVEAEDDYVTFDGVDGFRQALGSGGRVPPDPLGPYRVGRYGGLVGTPVDDLAAREPSGLVARLDSPEALGDVDPDADEVPVYLTGTVTAEHPVDVAVSVNGVLAGWCRTEAAGRPDPPGEEQHPFWVVVPEALLERGENEVDLYEVRGPADGAELSPITLE